MNERDDMTCAELADVAAELALGVLTGRERAMAVAHLDACDGCREHVRQLMATGEQLLELLPPAEPPAGFETRVLERLGLPVPAGEPAPGKGNAYPQLISPRGGTPVRRGPARGAARPGREQPTAPPARPGGARRPGRVRRVLAATAVGFAVIAAGLGGWRVGVGNGPAASSASGPLTSASLTSATQEDVGEVYVYSGTSKWLYMSVDLESGNERVMCEVMGADGRVTVVGTFHLTAGYGAWGSPGWANLGPLTGARLVTSNGTVLASASFRTA
jgi:hypothetical protein